MLDIDRASGSKIDTRKHTQTRGEIKGKKEGDVAQVTAQEIDLMKLNAFNPIITMRSHHYNIIHQSIHPNKTFKFLRKLQQT